MAKLTFLGDVHGKMRQLKEMDLNNKDLGTVIQVGDLGMGFSYLMNTNSRSWDWNARHSNFTPINRDLPLKEFGIDYFIRGNHDSPLESQHHSRYLGDYGVNEELAGGLFWCSGAWSIDRFTSQRIEGLDWWADEELSIMDLNNAINLYEEHKPRIVVSHDCPFSVAPQMGFESLFGQWVPNRTSQALDAMFEIHKPEYWFFGHHHDDKTRMILDTTFRCVDELSLCTIEV